MELNHCLFSYNNIDSSMLLQLTRTVLALLLIPGVIPEYYGIGRWLTREVLNTMAVNLDPHMYHSSDLFSLIL